MGTPPRSTNHVSYFGEARFLWAPKRPQKHSRLPTRNGRKTSSRSLDFSKILVHHEDDENLSLLGSYERKDGRHSNRNCRNETPVFMRNLDSPGRNDSSPLAFENTIARRIDFATPQQSSIPTPEDSVFTPSPTSQGILAKLKRSSVKRMANFTEQHCRLTDQKKPESCSPLKRAKWTRLIR